MAVDRTRLPQPTRLVLLEEFERDTDTWREHVDTKMERLTSRLDVLGAKIAVYATIGGVIGAALGASVADRVARLLFS